MRNRVMVVGAGMMGSGIGAMAALAGHPVTLVDLSEEQAAKGIEKALECIRLREEQELATHEEARKAAGLFKVGTGFPGD